MKGKPYLLASESLCLKCDQIIQNGERRPDCDREDCPHPRAEQTVESSDPRNRGKKEIHMREVGELSEILPALEFPPLL